MVKRLSQLPHWVILAAIGGALRLVNLGGERFWYDESFTAWIAQLPGTQLLGAIRGDVHPPLWYTLEWIVAHILGTSEIALRLPSAIASTVAIVLLYLLARDLFVSTRTAFSVGLIAALLPAQLYYAQEARVYALLCCFVLLMLIAVIRRRWGLFVLAALGALYSQNLGALYVAAIGGWAIWERRRWGLPRMIPPALAMVGVGVGYLPWVPSLIAQLQHINNTGFWITPLTPGSVLSSLVQMQFGWRTTDLTMIVIYTAAFAFSIVGLIASRKLIKALPEWQLLLVAVAAPPLLAALISVLWRSIYLPRAFLPSALIMTIFWGCALQWLRLPERKAFISVLAPALLIGVVSHYMPASASGARWDIVRFMAPMKEQWQAGDILYFDSISPVVLAHYYFPDTPYIVEPGSGDLNAFFVPGSEDQYQISWGSLKELRNPRVWILLAIGPTSNARELALDQRLKDNPRAEMKAVFNQGVISIQLWLLQNN